MADDDKEDSGLRLAEVLSAVEVKFWKSSTLSDLRWSDYAFMFASLAVLLACARYVYYGHLRNVLDEAGRAATGSLLTVIAQFAAAYLVHFVPQTSIRQRYFGLVYALAVSVHATLILFILTNLDRDNRLVAALYSGGFRRWHVAIIYGLAGVLLIFALVSARNWWASRLKPSFDAATVLWLLIYACFAAIVLWLFVLAKVLPI
jgi:hypothetical protein